MEQSQFEQAVLRIARDDGDRMTPEQVAHKLRLPVREAERMLDRMVSDALLELDSDDDGNLFYFVPGHGRAGVFTEGLHLPHSSQKAEQALSQVPPSPGVPGYGSAPAAVPPGPPPSAGAPPMPPPYAGAFGAPPQGPPGYPSAPAAAGADGYGAPAGYGAPSYPPPGYGGAAGYPGAAGAYGAPGGYGQQSGYAGPAGYAQPPGVGYGAPGGGGYPPAANGGFGAPGPAAYDGRPGRGAPPPYGSPQGSAYAAPTTYGQPAPPLGLGNGYGQPFGGYQGGPTHAGHGGASYGTPSAPPAPGYGGYGQNALVPLQHGGAMVPSGYAAVRSPTTAAVLSFIPGAGQLYNGEVGKGLAFFLTSMLVVAAVPPMMPFAVAWAALDAYRGAHVQNRRNGVAPPSAP